MAMADEHCERIGSQLILTDPPSGRRARGDIRGRDGGVLAQWNRRRHCGRSLYIYICVCVRVFIYKVDRWRGVEFITNFCVFSNRE